LPLYLSSLDCTHRESQPLPKSSKNAASLATHCTANNVASAKHATPGPCRERIGCTGSANARPIPRVYCACKLCVRTRGTSEGLGGVNEVRAQQRVCCSVIGQEAKANLYSSLAFACTCMHFAPPSVVVPCDRIQLTLQLRKNSLTPSSASLTAAQV